jgi:hypothetical protein
MYLQTKTHLDSCISWDIHFGKQRVYLMKLNIWDKNLKVVTMFHRKVTLTCLEYSQKWKCLYNLPAFCLLYFQNKGSCIWFNAFVLFVSNTFVTLVLLFWTPQFVPLYQGSYYLKYEDRIFLLSDETKYVYSVISLAIWLKYTCDVSFLPWRRNYWLNWLLTQHFSVHKGLAIFSPVGKGFYCWITMSGQTTKLNWIQLGDLPSLCAYFLCRCHLERGQACKVSAKIQHKARRGCLPAAPGRANGTVPSVRAGVQAERERA